MSPMPPDHLTRPPITRDHLYVRDLDRYKRLLSEGTNVSELTKISGIPVHEFGLLPPGVEAVLIGPPERDGETPKIVFFKGGSQ